MLSSQRKSSGWFKESAARAHFGYIPSMPDKSGQKNPDRFHPAKGCFGIVFGVDPPRGTLTSFGLQN